MEAGLGGATSGEVDATAYRLPAFTLRGPGPRPVSRRLETLVSTNVRGDKDQGWSLEAAIPWSNFDSLSRPPQVGTVWKANLNQWDGVELDRRMSIWSDPQQQTPWPHIPQRFGELTFVQ